MVKEDFDFKALKALKYNAYKKQYFKDAVLNKSKGGLVLTIFDIGTEKKTCAFIPFVIYKHAEGAFKAWNKLKDNTLKKSACKVALVRMSTKKGDDGVLEVTLNLMKGFKKPDLIEQALKPVFDVVEKRVKVLGSEEEEETSAVVEEVAVPKSNSEIIKALIIGITGVLKEELPKVIVPNIKAKKVSQTDADVTNELLDNLSKLETAYKEASTEVQQKIEKHYLAIMGQVPKLQKIKDAIDNLIGIESMEDLLKANDNDAEEVKRLKELLDYVLKETASIWKNFDQAEQEISNSSSEVIKGGEDLLNALFN